MDPDENKRMEKNMKNHPLMFVDNGTGEVMKNSLGYSQVISTLTAVGRVVSKQKFYEIPPADYVPIVMGNGAYKRTIINWRTYVKGEGFDAGLISNASNNAGVNHADAAFDQISQNVLNWALGVRYNVFELQEALMANTLFSLIEARELARRKLWDLGIQKTAFLGIGAETGVLNNANVTIDSATIAERLSTMNATEFNTFVGAIYSAYRAECNYTAKPTHFIIPEKDYNSLVQWPDATYPLRTKLSLLLEAFQTITSNQGFKILPCVYCDKSQFGTYNRYVLLNYDESSVKMDLNIDYTLTQAGTQNGFTWENIAYGSFTGVVAQRPKEMLYFANTAA